MPVRCRITVRRVRVLAPPEFLRRGREAGDARDIPPERPPVAATQPGAEPDLPAAAPATRSGRPAGA